MCFCLSSTALVSRIVPARASEHQLFPTQGTQTQGGNSNLELWDLPLCDRCDCAQVQDEVHALLMCRVVGLCALMGKYAHLFSQFAGEFSVERPYLTQPLRAQAVSDFLLQYDNSLFFFVSELMDLLLAASQWRGPVTGQSAKQSG